MKNISLIPLGGASEIGANSYYLKWRGAFSVLLDCGLRGDGPTLDALPAFDKADGPADFIVITHAHGDHLGALPYAEKKCLTPNGKILMTRATRALAEVMLLDTGKIMKKSGKVYAKWQCALYSQENIDRILKERVQVLEAGSSLLVNDQLTFRFLTAGHIAGAVMVEVKDPGFSFLYTGDFSATSGFAQAPWVIPEDVKPDVLLCEGTRRSGQDRNSLENKLTKLAEIINKAAKAGAGVMVPSLALGRVQDVLLAVGRLKSESKIPADLPVFVSYGLPQTITSIYLRCKVYKDFPAFRYSDPGKLPGGAFIFIAVSGQVQKVAEKIVKTANKPEAAIIFPSSYTGDHGNFADWRRMSGFKGRVESVDFANHASFEEVAALVQKIKAPLTIFCHGPEKNLITLKKKLKTGGANFHVPAYNGEEILFWKTHGQFEYRRSSVVPAYIVTVGNSLIDNISKLVPQHMDASMPREQALETLEEFTASSTPAESCVEINTLVNISKDGLPPDAMCLLVSNRGSAAAGKLLAQYFLPLLKLRGYNTVVKSLDPSFFSTPLGPQGPSDFVSVLFRLLDRYPMASLVVSGGFKFQAALSYMAGTLMGRTIYYKHKNSSVPAAWRLPGYPLQLDTKLYREYRDRIEAILNSDIDSAFAIYRELPQVIKNLLVEPADGLFELSVIGILARYTCRIEDEKYISAFEMDRAGFNRAIWACHSAPQTGEAPAIADLRSPQMREFVVRIAQDPVVDKIRFKTIAKDPAPQANRPFWGRLDIASARGKRVRYKLSAGGYSQYISVHVKHPYEQKLVTHVGLEAGHGFDFPLAPRPPASPL